MKKIITAAAISTILILTGCSSNTTSTKTSIACEEDQPCWDCNTMGNKVCGELPKGIVRLPESECPLFQPVCYDHLTPWAKGH
jgi:hypothetical protein